MSVVESKPKVLWPVDAFQCDRKMIANVHRALVRFFGSDIPRIQPVYVLTANASVTPISWFDELLPNLRKDANEKLKSLLVDSPFPVAEAKILVEPSRHLSGAIEKLNEYARQTSADLVIIPTQAKSGLKRLVLGSFAESMLIYSKTPLLTISPKLVERGKHRRRCLVPIDFESEDYLLTADRIIDEAKRLNVEVLFFHSMLPDLRRTPWPNSSLVFDSRDLLLSRLSDEQDRRRHLGDQLARRATENGCSAKHVMSLTLLPTEEAILETATKKNVDFIAMASQSTPFSFLLAGSITRHVIRQATCPVWALSFEARKRNGKSRSR